MSGQTIRQHAEAILAMHPKRISASAAVVRKHAQAIIDALDNAEKRDAWYEGTNTYAQCRLIPDPEVSP